MTASFYDFKIGNTVSLDIDGEWVQGAVIARNDREEFLTLETWNGRLYGVSSHVLVHEDDTDLEAEMECALESFEHAEANRRQAQREANGQLFS